MFSFSEVIGLDFIAFSLALLICSLLVRRRCNKLSIDFVLAEEHTSQLKRHRRTTPMKKNVWIIMLLMHALFLEVGLYITSGYSGVVIFLVYIGTLFIYIIDEVKKIKLDPIERLELDLDRIQEAQKSRPDVLLRQIENIVKTHTYNQEQRIKLLQYLAKRKDTIGQIALELSSSQT